MKQLNFCSRCHADIRDVIEQLNPGTAGWGNYFRTETPRSDSISRMATFGSAS
ncbi:MAG: group II intron maturase-specific domain-containing protein [Polyangiaceae bacterium]